MGIPKLLDLLDSVKIPVELKDFSGKKIAVDGHCWIYNAMGIYKFRVKRGTTNPL
jgi:exonuclease-1